MHFVSVCFRSSQNLLTLQDGWIEQRGRSSNLILEHKIRVSASKVASNRGDCPRIPVRFVCCLSLLSTAPVACFQMACLSLLSHSLCPYLSLILYALHLPPLSPPLSPCLSSLLYLLRSVLPPLALHSYLPYLSIPTSPTSPFLPPLSLHQFKFLSESHCLLIKQD